MFYVYVIQHTKTFGCYIGRTQNLAKRLAEHNSGRNKSTKRLVDGNWEVVYLEIYRSLKDAKIRESRLKSHGRAKQELFKRIKNSMLDAKK